MAKKEHGNECGCEPCKETRATRLRNVNARLRKAESKSHEFLKDHGFRGMRGGMKKTKQSFPRPEILPNLAKRATPKTERCVTPGVKGMWQGERVAAANETVRYTVARNGAVINGYEAKHEDITVREMATKSYNI